MKSKFKVFLIFLYLSFLVIPAIGQSTLFWTGGINGTNTGTDIGQSNNWGGNLPQTSTGDTCAWDGRVPGNLSLAYNTIILASGPGQSGINFHLLSSQTGAVSVASDIGATAPGSIGPTIAIQDITI